MSDPREPFELIRPLIVEATTVWNAAPPCVRVALEHGGELYTGEAALERDGSMAAPEIAAAGQATVAALDLLTPAAVEFALEWSAAVSTREGLPPVAATVVAVIVAGVPMRYAGAVLLDGDPATAGARSTLDALNRRLGVTGL